MTGTAGFNSLKWQSGRFRSVRTIRFRVVPDRLPFKTFAERRAGARSGPLAVRAAVVGVLLLGLSAVDGGAQVPLAEHRTAAVDSATAARDAWRRGAAAFNANDMRAAHTELKRAALAWPTQPEYLWGRVISAARIADTADVIAGLMGYVNIGLGRMVHSDTTLRRYHAIPAVRAAEAKMEANIAPRVKSHRVASMADSTFWPEGVDFDARTGNFYVASIRHRTVAELRPDGTTRELWARGRPDLGAMMGVRVDMQRGVLWATTSGVPQTSGYLPADSGIAALLRIRIADGVIERRWDIPPAPGGHALGDLAVSAQGDVFMTDSNHPVLYRLRSGGDTLEHMTSPLFRSLQGMAPTPDGRTLYVADYSHGLLRVDLRDGQVVRLDDAPGSTSIGCDGIVLDRTGAIIAVQNGVSPARIMRFVIDSNRTRITRTEVLDRNSANADEPTIGTLAHGVFVYVANSQWDKYDSEGKRRPTVPLTAPLLLGVPLPPGGRQ